SRPLPDSREKRESRKRDEGAENKVRRPPEVFGEISARSTEENPRHSHQTGEKRILCRRVATIAEARHEGDVGGSSHGGRKAFHADDDRERGQRVWNTDEKCEPQDRHRLKYAEDPERAFDSHLKNPCTSDDSAENRRPKA